MDPRINLDNKIVENEQVTRCQNLCMDVIITVVNDYRQSLFENIKLINKAEAFFESDLCDLMTRYSKYNGNIPFLKQRCRELAVYFVELENKDPKKFQQEIDLEEINLVIDNLIEASKDLNNFVRNVKNVAEDFQRSQIGMKAVKGSKCKDKNGKPAYKWYCPCCYTINQPHYEYCYQCGTKLIKPKRLTNDNRTNN